MSFTLINPLENEEVVDRIVYTSLTKSSGSIDSVTNEYFHGLSYVPLFLVGYYESVLQSSSSHPDFYQDQFGNLPHFLNYTSDGAIGFYISAKADRDKISLYIDIPDNDPGNITNSDISFSFITVILKEKMPSS